MVARAMCPALLALAAVLVCARAESLHNGVSLKTQNDRGDRALAGTELPHGCLYERRWHTEGTAVMTREACLSCVCGRGALSCRRRACKPLPDPPPKRCHVLHRRGACCPELHCPNGITTMEHGASVRFENDDFTDIATPSSVAHACVEGGTVFAAGSAMSSGVACEHCFCLGGARRCVRPSCLPPPRDCAPRPAPGACCPQRYYCDHSTTDPPQKHHLHDCEVDGEWIQEGERVLSDSGSCKACFCLRGLVRCQPLQCAPPLLGCAPLLRPGECCPHQYQCHNHTHEHASSSTKNDDRSFHISKSTKLESTTKKILTSMYMLKNTAVSAATINHLVSTTKVKRKTNDTPPETSSRVSENATVAASTEGHKPTAAKLVAEESTTEIVTERTTEQPDGTVKIVINGTINCTAELSSTSLPLNFSVIDTDRVRMEAVPRVPIMNTEIKAQTYSPNDIITDKNVNSDFDENETFTINVTSSLITNTSHSTLRPVATASKIPAKIDLADALNISKKTKGDYDYDYTEPTLPPSLPNLKIIPFVAADAVVDDDTSEDTPTYPILEREDKFPVYYPNVEQNPAYATRREDVAYLPTQYPVFVSDKESQYPALTHHVDLTNTYHGDIGSTHEYIGSASLGSLGSGPKTVTKAPEASSTFELDTSAMNLFSPPVETEGGFVPKGPGIIDDYYAVYPSTPPGPAVPLHTTSMRLDVQTGKCEPRACPTPPPRCTRSPPAAASAAAPAQCCGDLVCQGNETIFTPAPINDLNETKIPAINNMGAVIKLAPMPLAVTAINTTTTERASNDNTSIKPATDEMVTILFSSSEKPVAPVFDKEVNVTSSQEYEDDEDEGFSFGSVLKLLLSDNYETTTVTAYKKPSTEPPTKGTTSPIVLPTRRPSTIAPFIPLPPRPYIPTKKSPTTVDRIDHLVLGEATAIKKTTMRPLTTTKPVQNTARPVVEEGPRPPNLGLSGGVGAGLLKLAGCNIYGRMYRVGRIITELSNPCQECWCTELGVQCKPLGC